jgi:hypothetical protein
MRKMQDEPSLLRLADDQFKDKTITHTRNNGLALVESMEHYVIVTVSLCG